MFVDTISNLPMASLPAQALNSQQALEQADIMISPAIERFIFALAGNSSFLAQLIARDPSAFEQLCDLGPQPRYEQVMQQLLAQAGKMQDTPQLMKLLRVARGQIALITAAADVSKHWNAQQVTAHLSDFADLAIRLSAGHLLQKAHRKGLIALPAPEDPSLQSGLLILALGKLGGHELNYSSDIDLMVLFDADAVHYSGRHHAQHFFSQLAQELCALLQERTRDGYVFRTDLRLRPDPRSTPLAVNLHSAITYYESLGQNWERAAMIKARPVFADTKTEASFRHAMQAFIWRRHLDFAAINDIDSIKRQINVKVGEQLNVPGHHVKLGRGGIREIEFYVQTQQLIWGGRETGLRLSSTDAALCALHHAGHLSSSHFTQLREAYWYLRRVEHYIQMTRDQQNHTIPEQPEGLRELACFLGYAHTQDFEADTLLHCRRVHDIYAASMKSAPPLSHDGNLVFTGVEADPDTLRTLLRLGFTKPQSVSDMIQSWHRGGRRATRTLKARQLLTELTPALLSAFSDTPNPDDAFRRFDEFISKVPVGVQIFSLLTQRLEVLQLLAMILGSAPAVSEGLARNPALMDVLLERDLPLLSKAELETELQIFMEAASDEEDALRRLRQFKHEKSFHAGVKLLAGDRTPSDCGIYLSNLADSVIAATYRECERTMQHKHGAIDGSDFAILGLGKLGTRELTFGSDLDLILLYSSPDGTSNGGERSIESHAYFQRLASRLTSAFTLLTQEGRLYALDMRLRPGGSSGPLATHVDRLEDYFERDGWDVEALGLTRARVVHASSESFAKRAHEGCLKAVSRGYDKAKLARSIQHLRNRIARAHPTNDPWHIKYVAGGLMDISLIAQFFRVSSPAEYASTLAQPSDDLLESAASAKLLNPADAKTLKDAYLLQRDMQHVLRLCSTAQTITDNSTRSLRASVARLMNQSDCDTLKTHLEKTQQAVLKCYERIINKQLDTPP